MNPKDELRDFLSNRRARLTPAEVGLPVYGVNRRVTGLRHEEVALLAGISVEYYIRLERGRVGSVSDTVLDRLAHALQLDEAERDHLHKIVRAAAAPSGGRRQARPPRMRVRATVRRVLDLMPSPAYIRNGRFDILAANDLGRALYGPVYEHCGPGETPNSARFVFLDPTAADFFVDLDSVRSDAVAFLRAEAGGDPYSRELHDLIGELSTRSEQFRHLWAAHDVRYHRSGVKRLHHPLVGDLTLDFEAFELPSDPGQRLNVYTAAPDSPSAQALSLLACWAAPPSEPVAAQHPLEP